MIHTPILTQDLARSIIALDRERSSMIPGADPAKFNGRVHTEKKKKGWGGGGVVPPSNPSNVLH